MIIYFRALERWGSLEALEQELKRRREAMEDGERYRKGNSYLLVNKSFIFWTEFYLLLYFYNLAFFYE